jgi:hypothetical protein
MIKCDRPTPFRPTVSFGSLCRPMRKPSLSQVPSTLQEWQKPSRLEPGREPALHRWAGAHRDGARAVGRHWREQRVRADARHAYQTCAKWAWPSRVTRKIMKGGFPTARTRRRSRIRPNSIRPPARPRAGRAIRGRSGPRTERHICLDRTGHVHRVFRPIPRRRRKRHLQDDSGFGSAWLMNSPATVV